MPKKSKRRKDRRRSRGVFSGKNAPRPHKGKSGRKGKARQNKIKAINCGRAAPVRVSP